jgi:VanZ family protein
MPKILSLARWVPFLLVSIASLWASAQTTQGYRDPTFDWDISWPAIANALTKMPHTGSMFMIFLLGALAVGVRRLWLAALLAVVVAIGWELVQMPTIGNNPRLADLAPDLVGIGLGWAIVALGAMLWRRSRAGG